MEAVESVVCPVTFSVFAVVVPVVKKSTTPYIAFRLVVKKSVEEAEVIIEVEAKMLFTNRFRNLFSAVPRLYVLFRDGVMSVTVEEPVIDSVFRVVEP